MKKRPKKHVPFFRRSPLEKTHSLLLDFFDRLKNPDSMIPPRSMMIVREDIFTQVGEEFKRYFIEYADLKPDHKVLDVGCGVGRMAIPLTGYLTAGGEYYGFDIRKNCIAWCQKKISSKFSNFHFLHSNVFSKHYNSKGKIRSTEYKFPFEDAFFDLVIVVSVFTHMLPDDVTVYLGEISRVLKPGGKCLVTFYILREEPGVPVSKIRGPLNFKFEGETYHTTNLDDPETAVAFKETFVETLLPQNRFKLDRHFLPGTWSKREDFLSSQDVMVLSKV